MSQKVSIVRGQRQLGKGRDSLQAYLVKREKDVTKESVKMLKKDSIKIRKRQIKRKPFILEIDFIEAQKVLSTKKTNSH